MASEVDSIANMVTPDLTIPVLVERPRVAPTIAHRALFLFFSPILRPWRNAIKKRAETKLSQLVSLATSARSRQELEYVLGKPKYALRGSGFEAPGKNNGIIVPDRIEAYKSRRCLIDVWFLDGKMFLVSAAVAFNAWDALISNTSEEKTGRTTYAAAE